MPRVASEIPVSCTAGQLAQILGKSERVIIGRKGDGRLPTHENGGIDLQKIIQAGVEALAREQRAAAATDIDQAKLQEVSERARWLRLRNEMLEGDLIPAPEMENIVGAAFDAARAKVLAVPAAYGPRLAAEMDAVMAREMLTKALHEALGDLADGEVVAAVKDRARRVAGRLEGGDEAATEAGAAS